MVAERGAWTDADKILICRLKLSGPALSCVGANPELKGSEVTFQDYVRVLKARFQDQERPEDYILSLNLLKQRLGEGANEFADRCLKVGEKTLTDQGTPEQRGWERKYVERLILATFIKGLRGEAKKILQYYPPHTLSEAVAAAGRVERVEGELSSSHEVRAVATGSRESEGESGNLQRSFGASRDDFGVFMAQGELRDDRERALNPSSRGDRRGSRGGPIEHRGTPATTCYRCGGVGHLARVCGTPIRVTGVDRPALRERVHCFRCHELGHFARECTWTRPDGRKNRPNGDGLRRPPGHRQGKAKLGGPRMHGVVGSQREGLVVDTKINGRMYKLLVDTGADVTLIRSPAPRSPLHPIESNIRGITGGTLLN